MFNFNLLSLVNKLKECEFYFQSFELKSVDTSMGGFPCLKSTSSIVGALTPWNSDWDKNQERTEPTLYKPRFIPNLKIQYCFTLTQSIFSSG